MSFERYAKVSIELFEVCVVRGATGIAITDKPTSPLANNAKLVLMYQTRYLTFIDSYVAPSSLANAILTTLAVQWRRAASRSLARTEETWQLMDTYVSAPDADLAQLPRSAAWERTRASSPANRQKHR